MTNGVQLNGASFWKNIAMFLAGLVLAMASFYVAEFRRTITRDDAIQIVEQLRPGPPWVQDREHVMRRLEEDRRMLGELLRERRQGKEP